MQTREEEVLPPLPFDQDWLIEKGQVLGFRLDKGGICYGVAIVARNAILADEFDVFIKRLYLINKYDKYELLDKTTAATVQLVELMEALKKQTPAMTYTELYKSAISELSEEDQLLLTIKPFFEAVELYQQHFLHPHLFDKPLKFNQNDVEVSNLILPLKLAEQGGIDQVGRCNSIFKQKEIFQLLEKLADEFRHEVLDSSIPLTLSSMDHSITLKFDPGLRWSLIDTNHLPPEYLKIGEENLLAEKIMRAFSFTDPKKKDDDVEKFISIDVSIHSKKSQTSLVKNHIQNWLDSPEVQDLLRVTPAKAKRINSKGASWLSIALRLGDEKTLFALLATDKAPINKPYDNVMPIYTAASNGTPALVKKLIELGADVNATNHLESDLLLLFSESKGLLYPIMALINNKNAGFTPKDTEDVTPLHGALLSGNDDMVRLLLVKNASLTARLFNIKPVELAQAFNFEQIAESITDYKNMIKQTNELLSSIYAMTAGNETKKMEFIVQDINQRFLQHEPVEDILRTVKEEISKLQKEIIAVQELKNTGMFARPTEKIEAPDAETKNLMDDLYNNDSDYESDTEESERKTNKLD